jgi:Icc protein
MRVVQLSDCHVSGDPAARYRGVDARATLETLLPTMQAWAPDRVLATGDLSEDGSPESYRWLADRLGALAAPVLALPGNHDDAEALAAAFPGSPQDGPAEFAGAGWRVIGLNSAVPGAIPGRLGPVTLAALDAALEADDRPVLIALHHQPLPVASPWIDRYPLLEPAELWRVLRRHEAVRAVCWGHIHHAFDSAVNGIRALGCPSTVSNSLPRVERFTPDPAGPACRWFELGEDGTLETGLLRATEAGS